VLVRQFPITKFHDHYQRHFDVFVRRSHPRQHPGHFFAVSEGEDDLVDELILADGP